MLIPLFRKIWKRVSSRWRLPSIGDLLRSETALLRFCKIVNWAIFVGAIVSVLFIWVGWAGPWVLFAVGLVLLSVVCWLFYLGFDIVHHRVRRVVEVLGRYIKKEERDEGPCFLTPFLKEPIADVSEKKRQWRIFTKDDPEAKTQEMRNSKITISEAYVFVEPILENDGNVHPDFAHQMVYAYQDVPEVGSKGEPAIKKVVCDLSETTIRAICATYFLDEALSGGRIGFNLLGRIRVAAKILTKRADDIDTEKEGITAEELDVLKQRAEELDLEESESVVHAAAHIRNIEAELEAVHLKFSRVAFAITNFEISKAAAKARDLLHTREKEAEAAKFVAEKRGTELIGTMIQSLALMSDKKPDEIRKELADHPRGKLSKMVIDLLKEMMPQQLSLERGALNHIKVSGAGGTGGAGGQDVSAGGQALQQGLLQMAALLSLIKDSSKKGSSKKGSSEEEEEED